MQYTTEMCEGKLTPTRERDPFTLALGKPYHPRRVVGVEGKRLGIEAVMGPHYTKSTKSKPSSYSPQVTESHILEIRGVAARVPRAIQCPFETTEFAEFGIAVGNTG